MFVVSYGGMILIILNVRRIFIGSYCKNNGLFVLLEKNGRNIRFILTDITIVVIIFVGSL